jgi:hypothetical protein
LLNIGEPSLHLNNRRLRQLQKTLSGNAFHNCSVAPQHPNPDAAITKSPLRQQKTRFAKEVLK